MVNDGSAKTLYREMYCSDFWIAIHGADLSCAKMALQVLIEKCELTFSILLHVKTKY